MKQIWARLRAAIPAPAALALLIAFAWVLLFRGENTFATDVTRLERRVGRTLSRIEGVQRVDIVIRTIAFEAQGERTVFAEGRASQEVPCGAVAVVDGAQDPYVRAQIIQALCALLGLQAAQVEVLSAVGGGY